MHDGLFALTAQFIADPPDPNAVRLAMVTLAGILVSTVGTVLVALRSPRESRDRGAERSDEWLQELQDLQERADAADVETRLAQARTAVLEGFLWRQRVDPRKITTGSEGVDDVRI